MCIEGIDVRKKVTHDCWHTRVYVMSGQCRKMPAIQNFIPENHSRDIKNISVSINSKGTNSSKINTIT